MGDEPYAALLPWMVYAVVDRARGDGPLWAGVAALIAAAILLLTSTSGTRRRNALLVGGAAWFAALVIASGLHGSNTGFLAQDGRALSAIGFALIAFVSLAFTPAITPYTEPHVRTDRRDTPAYLHLNTVLTVLWGSAFAIMALSHLTGTALATTAAATVFNWIVPITLGAFAAHRTRLAWEDFSDGDDAHEADRMGGLAIDWEPPLSATDF